MHWAPLRLVQKRWKAAYIVGGWAATWVVFAALDLIPSLPVVAVLRSIVDFAWIYYATRVFRVREELADVPRPWWRMTGRPRAGFLLGALWLLGVAAFIASAVQGGPLVVFNVASAVEFGALAYLYFASSIRLRSTNAVATRPTGT